MKPLPFPFERLPRNLYMVVNEFDQETVPLVACFKSLDQKDIFQPFNNK